MGQVINHRAVVSEHGGPEVLRLVEDDLPEPKVGEVRVRVQAAGVSAFDLIYRRWPHLPGSPKVPFALGEDVVGIVDKLGEGVTALELGQTVAGGTWSRGIGGGYAEYLCLSASELVPVPAGIDPAEAVCLVVNYLTAHLHMHRIGEVRAGERMLVHGAAGGVGTALLQLGALSDLEMYGTASSSQQELVTELGAIPIDYRNQDFRERIGYLTGGEGVDIVIDPVGGAMHLWHSYWTLTKSGRLVWLGSAATQTKGLRVGPLSIAMMFLLRMIPDGKRAPRCPELNKVAESDNDWYRNTLTQLLALLAAGKLAPIIAERVPLAEAARAHEILEQGKHSGKVVLVPSTA
ncbi:MAG: zinc-binding dehydrogenase [Thermoleophilia bacterium]|nr:zinc-binding dehydrogenase [Thermoleophilia bacterium]